jgi:hypothetical protein
LGTTTVTCTATDDEGNTSSRSFQITVQDTMGPTVQDLRLNTTSSGITGIVLTFSEPLDRAAAVNPANYRLRSLGKDTRPGTRDDRPVVFSTPAYDEPSHTVTLIPSRPLALRQFYEVTVSGATSVTDLAGNRLNGNRTTGSDFVASFGRGTSLTYFDRSGDRVTVALTGGGSLELYRFPDLEGRELRILNPTTRSRLSGSVRPPRSGSDNHTTLQRITGTGGITNRLPLCTPAAPTRCFQVGTIAAVVVDSLLESGELRSLTHERLFSAWNLGELGGVSRANR